MSRTFWVDTVIDEGVAIAAQGLISLMTGIGAAQSRADQMTLLRTIIRLDIASTTHDSGEGSSAASIGIGIASQEAFAGGAVPDPNTATDFPQRGWVFRGRWRVFSFQAGVADVHVRAVDKDIKARRKLENGEPYIVFDNVSVEGASQPVSFTGLVRQLWLVA